MMGTDPLQYMLTGLKIMENLIAKFSLIPLLSKVVIMSMPV